MAGDCEMWLSTVNVCQRMTMSLRPGGGWEWWSVMSTVAGALEAGGGAICISLLSVLAFFLVLSCVPNLRTLSA